MQAKQQKLQLIVRMELAAMTTEGQIKVKNLIQLLYNKERTTITKNIDSFP